MLALSSHFVGWEVILSCEWLLQKSATEVVSHGFRNPQMLAFGDKQTWNAAILCQWPWESKIHICRKNIKIIVLNWTHSLLPDILSPERSWKQMQWEKYNRRVVFSKTSSCNISCTLWLRVFLRELQDFFGGISFPFVNFFSKLQNFFKLLPSCHPVWVHSEHCMK